MDDLKGDHDGPEQTFRDTERNLRSRIAALEAERDRYKALVKEAGEGLAFYADDDRYEYDQTCCFDTRGISRKRVAEIHETGGDILFDRGDRARTTLAKIKENPNAG